MIVLPVWFQRKWHALRCQLANAIERGDNREAAAITRRMNILADNFRLDV